MMNRWKLITCACLLLALLAVMPAQTMKTQASSAASCGWRDVKSPNPNPLFNLLYSVAAISPNDVWAVGYTHDNNDIRKTLIEHWDGSSWNVVLSPNPSTNHNELYAVAAISSNDVWAVGYYGTPNFHNKSLIEHWDGTKWSIVASPNRKQGGNILQSISAINANDIWTVGVYQNYNTMEEQTIAEHWNGSSWKLVSSPNPNPGLDNFQAVSALSTNDVWAVGIGGSISDLIEHWNGTKWSVIADSNMSSTWLNGVVAISASNVWIAGFSIKTTHIEHWNGKSWQVTPSPNPGQYGDVLRSITNVPNTNSLWTVGNYSAQGSQNNTLTLFHC